MQKRRNNARTRVVTTSMLESSGEHYMTSSGTQIQSTASHMGANTLLVRCPVAYAEHSRIPRVYWEPVVAQTWVPISVIFPTSVM